MFGDLSRLSDTNTLLSFIGGALVVELIMLILFRLTESPLTGKEINEWYDVYKFDAILLDTLSVTIGFVLASLLYPLFFSEFNVGYYLLVVLAVQITHDYLFWRYVIVPLPKGHNQVIDTMKVYAKHAGVGAIIGDSVMYILAVPIASILLNMSDSAGSILPLTVSVFALYPIMYLLYTKPIKKINR